jgi:hypothetical protein
VAQESDGVSVASARPAPEPDAVGLRHVVEAGLPFRKLPEIPVFTAFARAGALATDPAMQSRDPSEICGVIATDGVEHTSPAERERGCDSNGQAQSGVPTQCAAAAIHSTAEAASPKERRYGRLLAAWMVLMVALQATLWLFGFRSSALAEAVEIGVGQIESNRMGEGDEDQTRKAIQMQRATLPFWRALALIDDFVMEPLSLLIRALAAATLLSAAAALAGRPTGFAACRSACAAAQGYWMLGMAVRVLLMVTLRSREVDSSLALALPPGSYPVLFWLFLRQLDVFALAGWAVIGVGAWRRGQVSLAAAFLVCGLLEFCEVAVRVGTILIVEEGIRGGVGDFSVMPTWEAD